MRKKISILAVTALMVLVIAAPAMAEHFTGDPNWSVTFTADKKMESTFTNASMSDTLDDLQPGDDATLTVAVNSGYDGNIRWYMSNKTIQSLEDASANQTTSGGAYTYRLVYTDSKGQENVLYDSDKVGGEETEEVIEEIGEGLHEATNALEEYFLIDEMAKGSAGKVVLYVALDGETQNNNYQDTLAELQLNFAVEIEEGEPQTTQPERPPKTGDTNNAFIYFVIIGVAGLLLLTAGILRVVAGRKREEK